MFRRIDRHALRIVDENRRDRLPSAIGRRRLDPGDG
jgi:hypothetical protein